MQKTLPLLLCFGFLFTVCLTSADGQDREDSGEKPHKPRALLLYDLAEGHLKEGNKQLAEETAKQASATDPQDSNAHSSRGYYLQKRGLFPWAEHEYRRGMEVEAGSLHGLRARFLLSEMLHDLQRELPAARVLEGVVDAMDEDKEVAYMSARLGRDPASIRSRTHYFYAEHFRAEGNTKKQMEHLQEAVKNNATDADGLIAMYRLEGANEDWKETARRNIDKAAQALREQVRKHQEKAANANSERQRKWYERSLASVNNQLAWLIANTEGDYDEALRCSQRSLELRPDWAGYLDTLARCYFAKGDFENAVKNQSRAAELDPHSGQIQRQLELFKRATAAQSEHRR